MSSSGAAGQRTVSERSAHRKAIGLAVAAAVGGFLFGFDSSVINGAVAAIEGQFDLDSAVTGLVVAIALLGCALGAWSGGRLADRWGRTRVMVFGAVLFFVSSILSAIAWSAFDLAIWRFMAGVGIGIASVIAPAYIAEIAPARLRGRMGSLQQLAITIGIFAALLSDQLLAETAGGASNELWLGWEAWRWMFLVCVVPAAVYGILALRIPESPRYLVAKGRDDEARAVLESVLGPDEDVDDRIAQIHRSIAVDEKNAQEGTLKGSALGLKPIVWVGILLSVFQQFVGINVIFYYSTTLWQAVGFDESQSFLVSTITSVTNVAVTFIAIALVDKVGRRPILLIGSAGMTLSLGIMALAFTQASGERGQHQPARPVGPDRPRGRERVRRVLRGVVGPARLGPPGRDVPEPDPGRRPGRGGHGAVAGELRHHPDVPADARRLRRLDPLPDVRDLRGALVRLRPEQGAGDEGCRAGGHGRPGQEPLRALIPPPGPRRARVLPRRCDGGDGPGLRRSRHRL